MKAKRLTYLITGVIFLLIGLFGVHSRGQDYSVFIIMGCVFIGIGLTSKEPATKRSRYILAAGLVLALLSFAALAYFSKA